MLELEGKVSYGGRSVSVVKKRAGERIVVVMQGLGLGF